jgi:hypothetical protein
MVFTLFATQKDRNTLAFRKRSRFMHEAPLKPICFNTTSGLFSKS